MPKTLKEAKYIQLTKVYPRAKENPDFAQFCKAYRVKNEEFESGLDFVNSGWPKKTNDNLPLVDIKLIDRGTNTEYRWVKLPPEDLRALYLGIMIPGCCQVINGHSRQCVIDGTSLSDNGFYVLLKKNIKPKQKSEEDSKEEEVGDLLDGDIVAQSYAWISQNGNLCLDSIEWDKARVTEPILKNLMDLFALAVFQQNPQIRYVNVGTGGQTPRNFSQIARIGERQRQGAQYGDSASQYCIKSRLNQEQTLELQKKLSELDASIQDKILYLAAYLDMTEISQEMIQEISSRLTSSFIQPFPIINQPLTPSDFKTLTFENYQQLPADEQTKISTFCKLLNCRSLESFAKWLSVIPESERLEAVKQKDENKDTVLNVAAEDGPECLESILSLIPEPEHLEAVKQKDENGCTVLYEAALNPECLEIILSLIPEQERLEAVKQKNKNEMTVLHHAAGRPECLEIILRLLPKQYRLEAVIQKDRFGDTVLHTVANKAKYLKNILSLLPELERIEAVKQKDKNGSTVLDITAKSPKSSKIVLSLIPELERIEAVKQKVLFERTVLDAAAENPECFRIIPKKDLLNPEIQHVSSSLRVGICNRVCDFFMTVANYFVGSPYTKKCI